MREKLPAIFFYPSDWINDDVAGCSLAAQGLWLRMMFLMHSADRYGYLSKNGSPFPPAFVAQRCGTAPEQYETLLDELTRAGVPSRDSDGTIFSRRMVRDAAKRKASRKYGKLGGNPKLVNGGDNPPNNLFLVNGNVSGIGNSPGKGSGEGAAWKLPFEDVISPSLRCPKFDAAWIAFVEYRQIKKRDPLSHQAAAIAANKLKEFPVDTAIEAINNAILSSWAGVFPEKISKKNGAAHRPRLNSTDERAQATADAAIAEWNSNEP